MDGLRFSGCPMDRSQGLLTRTMLVCLIYPAQKINYSVRTVYPVDGLLCAIVTRYSFSIVVWVETLYVTVDGAAEGTDWRRMKVVGGKSSMSIGKNSKAYNSRLDQILNNMYAHICVRKPPTAFQAPLYSPSHRTVSHDLLSTQRSQPREQ